ncbi:hypothetical protein JOD54_000271 [Actinokineospora baliensis]|uniref:TIR domain-containing protein n=1 Tax=Actinokineospora baliensis TaxID=547056 RepID=UPI001957DD18|nr:TIR domain-containing protein [Actinokineospora baliensis]MBM7770067.1 hypothetical protein [Actinokineospora baliensis]
MKVFISWSGEISRNVAEVLREWIPSVIQAVEPYLSSEDIDKGARWSAGIAAELADCNFGIICATKDNLAAPWLNFEAGALSKFVETSRVSPFLFGVEPKEVTGPLLQFQATVYEREDMRKLVGSINSACPAPLKKLDVSFDKWWPELDAKLQEISAVPSRGAVAKRPSEDLLGEVLELVRAQHKILVGGESSDRSLQLEIAIRRIGHNLVALLAMADGEEVGQSIHRLIREAERALQLPPTDRYWAGAKARETVAVRRHPAP